MKLKKVLALVLALALVVTAFAACGGNNESSTASESSTSSSAEESSDAGEESSEPVSDTPVVSDNATALFTPYTVDDSKNLNLNGGMEPTGLNTLTSTYSIEFTTFRHIYETLTVMDQNDQPAAGAAESWDYDEDTLTYTFHLRKDGKWTNGDSVTANDFAFAWSQVLNPEVASDYAYFLFVIKNAEQYYGGECDWEEVGIKVIDDWTLEVTLENPTPYALSLFTFGTFSPVNQRFYEAVGAENYATEVEYFCTNGPYALTEWTHKDHWTLQKNPDFAGDALGTADDIEVEQITFKIIEDNNAAVNSFLAGELDITSASNGELIQQIESNGFEGTTYADGAAFYVYFNCSNEYLQNANLRKAFEYAMDKQSMIDTVYKNSYMPMTSFTAPGVSSYDGGSFSDKVGELLPTSGDAEKAKEYLAKALEELGCTAEDLNGKFAIDASQDTTALAMCAFYQEQWRQILGIEVGVNPMDTKQNSANRSSGDFTMSITGWGPDYNDPNTFLDLWVSDGGNNQTRWANDRYDELIASAATESDLAKREEYFLECEQIIADECMVAPNYWRAVTYFKGPKVNGGEVFSMNQSNYRWVDLA